MNLRALEIRDWIKDEFAEQAPESLYVGDIVIYNNEKYVLTQRISTKHCYRLVHLDTMIPVRPVNTGNWAWVGNSDQLDYDKHLDKRYFRFLGIPIKKVIRGNNE